MKLKSSNKFEPGQTYVAPEAIVIPISTYEHFLAQSTPGGGSAGDGEGDGDFGDGKGHEWDDFDDDDEFGQSINKSRSLDMWS